MTFETRAAVVECSVGFKYPSDTTDVLSMELNVIVTFTEVIVVDEQYPYWLTTSATRAQTL